LRASRLAAAGFSASVSATALLLSPPALSQTDAVSLPVTVVTANRFEVPLSEVLTDISVISRTQIEDSQAVSLADLLREQVGLEFARNGGAGSVTSFFLRGSESRNLVILVDGIRTPVDGIGSLLAVNTPLATVERVEVLRGNAAALYGDGATGGVIQIFTRGGGRDVLTSSMGVGESGAYQGSFGVLRRDDATTYKLVAGTQKLRSVSAINPSVANYAGANPDVDQSTNDYFNAGIDFTDPALGVVSIGLQLENGVTQYDDNWSLSPSDTHEQTSDKVALQASWIQDISDGWSTELSLGRSVLTNNDWLNGASAQGAYKDGTSSARQSTLRWINTFDHRSASNTTTVLGAEVVKARYYADATSSGYNASRNISALFLGHTTDIGLYSLQANVRNEQVSINDAPRAFSKEWRNTSALLGVGRALAQGWRTAVNVSTGYKAPSVYEASQDSSLSPERHLSKEASLSYADDIKDMRFVWFHSRSPNAILSDPPSAMAIRVEGVEWSGRWRVEKALVLNWGLTLQDAKNLETLQPASRRAQNFGNVGLTKTLGDSQVAAQLHFSGPRDNSEWDDVTLASYAVVDLTYRRALNKRWTFSSKLENATNASYQLANGYNTNGRGLSAVLSYSSR
jgi:vitamin B12 transporter